MPGYDYDLFVIGAGSGGVRCSRMSAAAGARVAVAEDRWLGGTCVNVGCVPKKLFVYGAHFAEDFEDAEGFGWHVPAPKFNWPTLRDNKTREIERLNGIYRNMLKNAGVTLLDGRATVIDPHTVEVDGTRYSCERILIATGGWPFVPDIPGSEHIITSNEVFYLESFPKRALVVGGGYIAVEFAGIFAGLGAETTLSYRRDIFLRGFDMDVRETVRDEVAKKGIDLRFNSQVVAVNKLASGALRVEFANGDIDEFDCVLYATGRVPNSGNLGLEQAGVNMNEKGAIEVNENFQTSVPSIYAIGDVIDRVQLTPVALAEGMALSRHLYQDQPIAVDYSNIPTAVFCMPNIGTVGLSEEEARAKYGQVTIFKSRFRHMKHTLSGRDEKTFMKLIVDTATDKVVGCHMVGADAGEVIQGIAIAMKAGATKAIFDQTIGIHPTAAEEFVTMREPVTD